jgi:hypothetical protein
MGDMRVAARWSILLLVALSASAQKPDAGASDIGKIKVYFYPGHNGFNNKVYSDQTLIGKLRKNQYILAELEPGRHVFRAGGDIKNGVTVNVSAGREYFVMCSFAETAGMWVGRPKLPCTLVDPEQGRSDIAKLSPNPQ